MTLLILVALPLVMAGIVLLFHSLPIITTPLTVATLIIMIPLCLDGQQVGPLTVLGRSVELLPLEAVGLAFCAAILALMVLYTFRSSQNPLAHSLTLLAMGLFAAATMVRSLAIGGLLFEMGIIAAVMLLSSARSGAAMSSMRTLILLTLAGLLLLLAAWALEGRVNAPENETFINVGMVALALGFGIALAIVPFHIWQPAVFYYGEPLAAVMLSVVFGLMVLLRLNMMLQVFVWPEGRGFFSALLLEGGLVTTLVGGAMAFLQHTVNRTLAYAALADLGMVIVGVGLGLATHTGFNIAALHFAYRGVAIVVVSMSLGILRRSLEGDDVSHLAGAFRRAPLAVISMMIGGFSLAGLPLTAGFATRLLLYRIFASQYPAWTALLVLCGLGPAWAFMRCVAATLTSTPVSGSRREPLVPGLLAFSLSLILLALGIYPGLLSLLPQGLLGFLTSGLFAFHGRI